MLEEHKITPSIQHIITQNTKQLKQDDIHRLFQIKKLPCFSTTQFRQHPLNKNDIFNSLVRVLEDWNKKVQHKYTDRQQLVNCRSQLFRNQFIYTSLKKIIIQNCNITTNLQSLYNWYRKNSSEGQNYITMKHHTMEGVDDDWDIRKTFKTNVPIQLTNYRRRQFNFEYFNSFNKHTQSILINDINDSHKTSQQQSRIKSSGYQKDDQLINLSKQCQKQNYNRQIYSRQIYRKQKQGRYPCKLTQLSQFKMQQEQIRRRRQNQQINIARLNWKHKKARYQQHTSINFYNAKFMKNSIWNDEKLSTNRTNAFEHIKRKRLDRFYASSQCNRKLQHQDSTHLLAIDGVNLISNPLQTKIKKKR